VKAKSDGQRRSTLSVPNISIRLHVNFVIMDLHVSLLVEKSMNFLTRSSVAAFFFTLAFTLAVVDKTAVATLVKVFFFGGFVDAGLV